MKNTHTLLNSKGISHIILPLVIVIVAVAGVAYMVASHADTIPPDPQPPYPAPIVDSGKDQYKPLASAARTDSAASTGDEIASNAYVELGETNGMKYGTWASDVAWCAAFSTWTWKRANANPPTNINYFLVKNIADWAQAHHRFSTHPKIGAMAFYGSKKADAYDHVGIVVQVKGNKIKLIEGNHGHRVAYHRSGKNQNGPLLASWHNFYTEGNHIAGFMNPNN